jgi:hypothetical protein
MMVVPLLLLAASVASAQQPASAGAQPIGDFKATTSVTARATASVRILPAVRFGQSQQGKVDGGQRRKSAAPESGLPLELLEFQ